MGRRVKMSWIVNNPLTWFQTLCINILKCGPVPHHLAFIMDGNRRYATKTHIGKRDGHVKGFDKLAETLQWCLELGIREVTVYAFSIENFKRPLEEVETLMELAREKYKRLLEEKDQLMKDGVCIRVIGNLNLVPDDIRKSIAEAMLMTKENNKVFLNVAFAYTSRDEIINAITEVIDGYNCGDLEIDDIDPELLSYCLYTNQGSDPDVLIRTSGETRLSDFLLWQTAYSKIFFADVFWPEFSIWHLLAIVFKYQRCYNKLIYHSKCITENLNQRKQEFLSKVELHRLAKLKQYLSY